MKNQTRGKNKFFILILFTLFAAGLSSCDPSQKTAKTELYIAGNLPLTGDLATYGVAIRDGANLATDDLKDSLEKKSIKLDFDFQDNQGQPKNAVGIFQSQLLKKPNIYVSGVSPQTMAVIGDVSKEQIPHFAWVYAADICDKYKNTFRTWLNFNTEAEHYIAYVKEKKAKRIAISYVNIEVCQFEVDSLIVPALHAMGIKDILIQPYDIQNTDFKNMATKTKDFKPDMILLNGFKGHMIQLVKDFRSYNLISGGNTMCSYDLLDAAPELTTEQLEGLRYTVPFFIVNQDKPAIKSWITKFKTKYNRNPLYTDAYAYDMTFAIYKAAAKLSQPVNNADLSKQLLGVQFDGITGPFKFTDKGDLVLSVQTCYYQNGKLIPQN